VILEFDAGQAIDLEQGLVAEARFGLDNRQPAPDRAKVAHGVIVFRFEVLHHGLPKLDGALEKVGVVARRHAQDVCAAIGVALGERGVACGDELHAIARVYQSAHKVRDVRAGPFGAGDDVKSGIEHGGSVGIHQGLL